MKYVDEFRDPAKAKEIAGALAAVTTRPWKIMEVCGGQTHSIVRFGIDQILPPQIALIHGPGCPVCVTPLELIDKALELALRPGITFCSFGDMLRVPGSDKNLFAVKAAGGDVRIVYSPLDALKIAKSDPSREVVFFAVGFETTAPTTAMAVYQAKREGVKNFSLLVSHVLVPPAIEAVLSSPNCQVNGFLAPGHVCAITGYEDYEPIAAKYRVPFVVTGFEPLDILQGIYLCVKQLEAGRCDVENQYSRAVRKPGNQVALDCLHEVFQVSARKWRGIGEIPASGLAFREAYRDFDAELRFPLTISEVQEPEICMSGLVLQGLKKPSECPAFGSLCNPEHPLGATMVSSEGACAAYFRYRRNAA